MGKDDLREFVLTTVILPPGVKNPGSVLLGLTPFPLDPVDPLDPVENSGRLDFVHRRGRSATFARKMTSNFQ